MTFSYTQFGPVAMIHEDGRAVAVAKFEDDMWRVDTYPLLGETASPLYHCKPWQTSRTLDGLIQDAERLARQMRGHSPA